MCGERDSSISLLSHRSPDVGQEEKGRAETFKLCYLFPSAMNAIGTARTPRAWLALVPPEGLNSSFCGEQIMVS